MEEDGKQLEAFGSTSGKKGNILKLQKIFPIIATTLYLGPSSRRAGTDV